jgi:hypothetical protein
MIQRCRDQIARIISSPHGKGNANGLAASEGSGGNRAASDAEGAGLAPLHTRLAIVNEVLRRHVHTPLSRCSLPVKDADAVLYALANMVVGR